MTSFGTRTTTSAVIKQWSDRQSTSTTLTLSTSALLLVAKTSSRFATVGNRRVGSVTSCVRPSDSKHILGYKIDENNLKKLYGRPPQYAPAPCKLILSF